MIANVLLRRPEPRAWQTAGGRGRSAAARHAVGVLGLVGLVGVGVVGAAAVGAPAAAQQRPPGRALLIAIDDYRDDRLDLPPGSSTADQRNMERLVRDGLGFRPEEIRLLTNQDASRAGILDAIDQWLIAGTRPGDRVFFSYSGHGAQQPDANGDEDDDKDETLVPWDTEVPPGGPIGNMVTDDDLEARFRQLADRNVLMVVDACHSGTISRDLSDLEAGSAHYMRTPLFGPFVEQAADLGRRGMARAAIGTVAGAEGSLSQRAREESFLSGAENLSVWTAVTPTQVALVERGVTPAQGVFTRRFVAGVLERRADANGNGLVSHAELLNYVRDHSQSYCDTERERDCRRNGARLTPTLETSARNLARDIITGQVSGDMQDQATDTLGQGNARDLRLSIRPAARVREGDKVVFEIESRNAGHLLVIDVNADRQVMQIFPNPFSAATNPTGRIEGGRRVAIPDQTYGFDFVAQPPYGDGLLIAVVTQDPVNLDDIAGSRRGFQPVDRPADYLSQLAQTLMRTFAERLQARGLRWSMAHATYTISR